MQKLENINKAMDYKKAIITHLADQKQQFEEGLIPEEVISNKQGRIQILTQTAMIEGEVNFFDGDEEMKTFFEYGLDRFGEELQELSPDMMVTNATGPIHIKNARFKSISAPDSIIEMDEMIVFSDQVVGMAIVK
ncbi:hypothetical protein [Rossellomorea yichunensis]|jgi:hypothetical protein|uniref:hypothetical protein n=1 Tax=Rossellomorea yichunensis TaxID=3077331 RepID=UPI0028DF71C4|nr:hypothetical protein [Rossellomorea sp. YC4-1]MDT9027415.1 hypothetical protein [Rossellomorea sp. YC4-1]